MTGLLSQIYFTISNGKEVDLSPLSMAFADAVSIVSASQFISHTE